MDGPRLVRREELDDLSDLLCDVFGFEQWYRKSEFTRGLHRPAHLRGAMVIIENGRPVSHILTIVDDVSIHGCRSKAASLGGVCTHPSYRQRGFASKVLKASLARVTAAGARILMVSGDRSLYRRNHCLPAGQTWEAKITRQSLGPAPAGQRLSVRRTGADEWGRLSPLHAAESVRFIRSVEFFSRCCFWWDCSAPETWVVESSGETLAYLSLVPDWRERERPVRWSFEYAGARAAIVNALPLVFAQAGLEEVRFRALGQDLELTYLLRERGLSLEMITAPGTHRLLNLPGLMRDLRPYLAALLPRKVVRQLTFRQQGEMCSFSLGEQRVEMDLSQAVKLALGGPDRRQVEGPLGEALAAIFPIPFPLPGFNYV